MYDDDDLDYSDYLPPHYSSPFPTTRVPPQPQYQRQEQEENDSSVCTADSSLSSSSEEYKKPRRKGLKNSFTV